MINLEEEEEAGDATFLPSFLFTHFSFSPCLVCNVCIGAGGTEFLLRHLGKTNPEKT